MYDVTRSEAPYLAAKGVSLEVDGKTLIEIDELSLQGHGVTAVMGPNGAGKSLLFRLLHGLVDPTKGEIFCHGDLTSAKARQQQSLVLQSPVLLRRSAEGNVRFVLRSRGLNTRDSKEILKQVALEALAKTPARRLSGGERQRLAIAQALATQPETLLLDEPTASLDPRSTHVIEDLLREINAQGTRILMITHDAMQAKRLANEVVFLSGGKVLEHTSAESFFDQPRTEQARAYLAGRLST